MKLEKALSLVTNIPVVAAGEVMRVVGFPEAKRFRGKKVARVTAKDDYGRTHVFTHDELHAA